MKGIYSVHFQISTSCSSSYIIIGNVFGPTDFNAGRYPMKIHKVFMYVNIILYKLIVFFWFWLWFLKGKRGYIGDNSEQFVVGPEFCGGALSKGGNKIAAESDSVGGIVSSAYHYLFHFIVIGYWILYLVVSKIYLNVGIFQATFFSYKQLPVE